MASLSWLPLMPPEDVESTEDGAARLKAKYLAEEEDDAPRQEAEEGAARLKAKYLWEDPEAQRPEAEARLCANDAQLQAESTVNAEAAEDAQQSEEEAPRQSAETEALATTTTADSVTGAEEDSQMAASSTLAVSSRGEWSWRSVGMAMRGLAQDVGVGVARTAQSLAVEVGRSSILLAAQLTETVADRQFSEAQDRARSLGWRVAERVVSAGGELNEALQLFDRTASHTSLGDVAHAAVDRAHQSGHFSTIQEDASPLLRELKFAPLSAMELLTPSASSDAGYGIEGDLRRSCGSNARVRDWQSLGALADDCWRRWREKHTALTASEGLYASLLADSRRTSALAAELSAVEVLLKEAAVSSDSPSEALGSSSGSSCSGGSRSSREKAMRTCCTSVEARAAEAVEGFRERIKNYPCGTSCPLTKQFRIARSAGEIDAVMHAFEQRVAQETEEALSQAMEIIVAPNLQTLAESLARRVEFWEQEIEDNWGLWTTQSTIFHEACEGVAEVWSDLQDTVLQLLAWVREDNKAPSTLTPPIVFLLPFLDMKDVQHHRFWEDLHAVLVQVAAMVALLGAWMDYHNLRGDGQTAKQAQVLLWSILRCFDATFDESFRGREAILANLAADASWRLVASAAEAAAPEGSPPWWSPLHWPSPPQRVQSSEDIAADSSSAATALAPMVMVSSQPVFLTEESLAEQATEDRA